ncbi:unnamed protein product [Arctogadus glacialis]
MLSKREVDLNGHRTKERERGSQQQGRAKMATCSWASTEGVCCLNLVSLSRGFMSGFVGLSSLRTEAPTTTTLTHLFSCPLINMDAAADWDSGWGVLVYHTV